MRPLAIDLFCGVGGWSEALLAEGWDVIGFDIERHEYGEHRYPAQLVVQDVLTLHGSQFRGATLIVASPPCQFFSYTAMPWSRAKALAAEVRADPMRLEHELALFNACFRIQREACAAAGRHIPLIVENVRGAIPWAGRSRWNFGSFHLWGDVPALMPITLRRGVMKSGIAHPPDGVTNFHGHKIEGFRFDGSGRPFQSASVAESGLKGAGPPHNPETGKTVHGMTRWTNPAEGFKAEGRKHHGDCFNDPSWPGKAGGTKQGGTWWHDDGSISRATSSKSPARKAASAMIAKIPAPLATWIARTYLPRTEVESLDAAE